ncbi:MAG: WYL domain-containing protein, partial [Chitinophagales bacterium]|nr:WYL domain-containing protein [Chitinophagales bacterium]
DIVDMREDSGLNFFAPIKYNHQERGYYYTQEGYSISEIPIEAGDLKTLQFVGGIAELFGDLSEFKQFEKIVSKLTDYFKMSGLLEEEDMKNYISLEKNESASDTQWIELILKAIKESVLLKVTHQKFLSEKSKEHLLQPYLLKEFRERWYLLAKRKGENNFLTYGLDRIKECEMMKGDKFIRDKKFDPQLFYKNAYGIIVSDDSPQEIRLSFTPLQAEYILSQKLHDSQKIISHTEKETVISLYLAITHDFIMQLLSYGAEVRVLKPNGLVRRLKDEVEKLRELYFRN